MNVKQSLDLLMGRLGGRSRPELRALCLLEMKTWQETECEGAEELPWFLITERAETDTEIGEPRIPLPSDFIREVEDENLILVGEDGVTETQIEKVSFDEAEERFGNAEPGTPSVYHVKGDYVILAPPPDRVAIVRFPAYYAKQPEPIDSDDSENGWFKWAPDVMMYGAGVIVATLHLKDPELMQLMTTLLTRAQNRLNKVIVAREEANRNRRMG